MPIENGPAAGLTAARAGNRAVGQHPDTTVGNPAPSPDLVACFTRLTSLILGTFTGRTFPSLSARVPEKIGLRPWPLTLRPPRSASLVMIPTSSGKGAGRRTERHIGMFAKIPAI